MATKVLMAYTNLLLSLVGTLFFLKETSSCQCVLKWVFCTETPLDLTAPDGKETLFREFFLRVGVYMLALSVSVMSIRVATAKSSPASEEDPTTIKVLNRVLGNTIEQLFIFVGLYAYFLYNKAGMTRLR